MFTGLIEKIGVLEDRIRRDGGWRVSIGAAFAAGDPLVLGESVAVQGVCLTVDEITAGGFRCDLLDETLSRTTLGSIPLKARVNLERAMKAGGRFGGHIVQGHVDAVGTVEAIAPRGRDIELRVKCPAGFARMCVEKGSVAIDGVSLTLVEAGDGHIAVDIIPHTLAGTSLSSLRPGAGVNLEADIIGKYVLRALGGAAASGLTEDTLRKAGFDV